MLTFLICLVAWISLGVNAALVGFIDDNSKGIEYTKGELASFICLGALLGPILFAKIGFYMISNLNFWKEKI